MEEYNADAMGGHIHRVHLYKTFTRKWWWSGMYSDCVNYCKSCPQYAIVTNGGKRSNSTLTPLPVEQVFQIIGVEIMELLKTKQGNKYAVVFQGYLLKWPLCICHTRSESHHIGQTSGGRVHPGYWYTRSTAVGAGVNLI